MGKLKKFLKPLILPTWPSLSLLLLRLIVGAAFVQHGWGKMQNPFGWMGQGAPVPGIFQFLAAFSEFGGGLALILGLLTSIAMLGLGFTMLVATYMHMVVMGDPFVNPTGGSSYELALVFLGVTIMMLFVGPGAFSVDAKLFGKGK